MSLLKPPSPVRLPVSNPQTEKSSLTSRPEPRLVGKLRLPRSLSTSSRTQTQSLHVPSVRSLRYLDFDVESINGSFDDPQWSVNFITCVAWSWVGSDEVESRIATEQGIFTKPQRRAKMLKELCDQIRQADVVTGHNLLRFDLPHINAECMRLGLPPLRNVVVQDTMRLTRTKGFKKGQDNLGALLEIFEQKESLNWAQWWKEYAKVGWPGIRSRAESDVRMHKELRAGLIEAEWLKPTVEWKA